jgi:hypothetical protein
MAIPKRALSIFCAVFACTVFNFNLSSRVFAAPEESQTSAAKGAPPQVARVFGRLDEIGSSPLPKIGLNSDTKKYSGTIISAYPEELLGDWGGQLKIFSYKVSDAYRTLDPRTCAQSVNLLRPGRLGRTNFCFHKDSSDNIILDPVRALLVVPISETLAFAKLAKQQNLSPAQQAEFGKQTAPAVGIDFENQQTDSSSSGVAGNQFVTKVFKTTTRQLGPEIFEKQLFTRSTVSLPSRAFYRPTDENVIWFKLIPADKNLYVRICGLSYSDKGQLLSKLVMSGTLVKGRRVETDPRAQSGSRQSEHEQKLELDRLQGELNRLRQQDR